MNNAEQKKKNTTVTKEVALIKLLEAPKNATLVQTLNKTIMSMVQTKQTSDKNVTSALI